QILSMGWTGTWPASRTTLGSCDNSSQLSINTSLTIGRVALTSSSGIQFNATNDITISGTSDLIITGGGLTIGSLTTNGGLLYTNGSGVVSQLATGQDGQCLRSSGGASMSWQPCNTELGQVWTPQSTSVHTWQSILYGGNKFMA